MKLKRVLTYSNLQNQKIERIPFEGKFFETYRQPQKASVWFIWGNSGSGKSSKTMQLFKELCKYYKGLYNPLEEGTDDADFVERTELFDMHEVQKNFFIQEYNFDEMMEYMGRRNSPQVYVIDSAMYLFKKKEQYELMMKTYPNKTYIITGHAEGKEPKHPLEKFIRYDANQKIYCEAYLASCQGRCIGQNGGQYIVWDEGYELARGVQPATA